MIKMLVSLNYSLKTGRKNFLVLVRLRMFQVRCFDFKYKSCVKLKTYEDTENSSRLRARQRLQERQLL